MAHWGVSLLGGDFGAFTGGSLSVSEPAWGNTTTPPIPMASSISQRPIYFYRD